MKSNAADNSVVWYWLFWIVSLLVFILAVVCFIIDTNQQTTVRCFSGDGVSTQPFPTIGSGFFTGKIEYMSNKVEIRIYWWINETYGTPSQIRFHGPFSSGGVGVIADAPSALTICGGNTTQTCAILETLTCVNNGLSAGCGILETVANNIDSLDTEIGHNFFNISGFISTARYQPELFYITLEMSDGTEFQRGLIGSICTRE